MKQRSGRGVGRSGFLVLALLALGCGASEGTRRPLRDEWPGGRLKCEGTEVRQGGRWVKDGPVTFYRADGSPAARGAYAEGLETGPWTEWLEDGSRADGTYREGAREGRWLYTHPNGSRQEEGSYVAGLRQGPWRWWYADGTLRGELEYRDGRLHGRVVEYRRDGSVDPAASGTYEDGERVAD